MPAATERLFFALRPDAAAAVRMHELALQLCATHALRARPLAIERLHLTLCFLGNHAGISAAQLAAAEEAGGAGRQAPFELTFNRVECLGRNTVTPVVLCPQVPSEPLRQLHDSLVSRVARTDLFQLDARAFKPHVTLLYSEKSVPVQTVAPVSWTATEVLLIRSHIGRAQHDVLQRHRLVMEPRAPSSAQ